MVVPADRQGREVSGSVLGSWVSGSGLAVNVCTPFTNSARTLAHRPTFQREEAPWQADYRNRLRHRLSTFSSARRSCWVASKSQTLSKSVRGSSKHGVVASARCPTAISCGLRSCWRSSRARTD